MQKFKVFTCYWLSFTRNKRKVYNYLPLNLVSSDVFYINQSYTKCFPHKQCRIIVKNIVEVYLNTLKN